MRVPGTGSIVDAAAAARAAGASLERILVPVPGPLSELVPEVAWQGIPLGFRVEAMGPFRDLVLRIDALRALTPIVYLPAGKPTSLRDARILASVGVACGLELGPEATDWEALMDLFTYAVLGRMPRARIEPFSTLAERYQPDAYTPWGALVYDDPAHYLHLDPEGRVAASARDLAAGRFLADSPEAIGDPARHPGLAAAREAWRGHFLADDTCARCPGFRVCMGRFAPVEGPEPGCSAAFAELMDVIELGRKQAATPPGPAVGAPRA